MIFRPGLCLHYHNLRWTAAQVLYNLTAGILRAVGNSRIPLYFLIFSAVLNIFLDLLFIIPLNLGTGGAALATVIAQGLSGILCLFYIVKKIPFLRLSKDDFSLWKAFALQELSVGIPMTMQYIVTSVGMLIIQTALNSLGTLAVTAYTVGNKIDVIMERDLSLSVPQCPPIPLRTLKPEHSCCSITAKPLQDVNDIRNPQINSMN